MFRSSFVAAAATGSVTDDEQIFPGRKYTVTGGLRLFTEGGQGVEVEGWCPLLDTPMEDDVGDANLVSESLCRGCRPQAEGRRRVVESRRCPAGVAVHSGVAVGEGVKHAGRLNKGPHRAISGDSNRQFEHCALGKFVKEFVGSEALALRHDDTTRRPANLEEDHEHEARRCQPAPPAGVTVSEVLVGQRNQGTERDERNDGEPGGDANPIEPGDEAMNDSERAGHTTRRRSDRQDECGDRRSAERNDLVDPDLVELAQLDVEESVAGTFLEGAPIIPVSSETGEGIDTLKSTLLDLCGFPTNSANEGSSLVRLLADKNAKWHRPALTTHGRNNHGLRSPRWRYILYADGSEELYDHQVDPNEWHNLADDPKLAGAKKRLAEWLPKINAPNARQRNK